MMVITNICATSVAKVFWHLQEFKLHRAGHTGVKPYKCGQCEVASFADVHRLNHYLKSCGKLNAFQCNQCGKMYSDQKSLSTHVSDTHNKTERKCALCPNAVYTSEGGYYTHMRMKHQIGRNGRKLQDVLKEWQGQETEDSDEEITDNDDNEKSDKRKKKRHEEKKQTPKRKRTDSSDEENTPQSKKKRSDDNKQTPKWKASESSDEENTPQSKNKKTNPENKSTKNQASQDNKKLKPTTLDKKRASKSTSGKKTSEPEEKNTQKMVYHCPMPKCNRLKFDDEQLYFKHLVKQHKIRG